MKKIRHFLLDIALNLFDGGDGGGQGAGAAAPGADGDSGNQTGASTGADTGGEANPNPTDARKAYKAFINNPANKPFHTQEINRIVGRHTRQNAALQAEIDSARPIIDALAKRYRVTDGDHSRILAALEQEAAEEAGVSLEEYRYRESVERENARLNQLLRQQQTQEQLNAWNREAEEMLGDYPDFDLSDEVEENKTFAKLLENGFGVRVAYEVTHRDEIKQSLIKTTEKNVTDTIRARGMRPTENAAASGSGHTTTYDVNKLTDAELDEISARVMRGEPVILGRH